MRTKNFRNILAAFTSYDTFGLQDYDHSSYYAQPCVIVNTDGKSNKIRWRSGEASFYFILIGGNGSTPPTENDYKLESPINLELTKKIVLYDNQHTITIVQIVKNTSSESVTLTEIALKLQKQNQADLTEQDESYGWKDWNSSFIVSRDLITPITIPAGETRTIQYAIEF